MSDVSRPQQQAATPTASVRRHGDYTHLVSGLWGSAPGIRLQQGEPTVQRTGNHLSGCSSEGTPDSEARAATAQRNRRRWQDPECKAKSLEWQRRRRARTGSTQDPRRARNRLQAIVDDWKGRGCVDCGYADIRAIDPDHIDGATKDGHVSRLVQLCASAARIVAELEKCVPRCARCHRRVTQVQRPCSWRSAERVPASWLRRLEFQDRNDAIKVLRGCADCGWRGWARGLDWDHVRGEKLLSIASLIANGRPWEVIEEEMAKCEVVCANCHRLRTVDRRARARTLRPERARGRSRQWLATRFGRRTHVE